MRITKDTLKKTLFGIAMLCVLSVSVFGNSFAVNAADDEKAAAREARRGVVRILTLTDQGAGKGTGFGIGKVGEETDIFITNRHVIVKEDDTVSDEIYILLDNEAVVRDSNGLSMNKEHMVKCKVLYTTEDYPDFAILQAECKVEGRVALPLLSSLEVNELDTVYALGYPGGADFNTDKYIPAAVADESSTQGVISSFKVIESEKNTEYIQHDADINPGNSGGPLITADGNVIAINSFIVGPSIEEGDDQSTIAQYSGSIIIDHVMDKLDELGIYYEIGTVGKADAGFDIRILAAAAAAVLVIIIVTAVCLNKKKSKKEITSEQADSQKNKAGGGQKAGDSGFRLQGVSGAFAGRRFAVNGRIQIGRDPQSGIAYPSDTKGISKRHCEIILQGKVVYVQDAGSTYGTFVNGVRIQPNQPVALNAGEKFYLGHPGESFVIIDKNRM